MDTMVANGHGIALPASLRADMLVMTERARRYGEIDDRLAVLWEVDQDARLRMLDDEDTWLRMSGFTGGDFSRSKLAKDITKARFRYYVDAIINRAVEIGALYVFGQDLSVSANDDQVQELVDRFWAINTVRLTGQQASRLLEVELEITGNVFLALFVDARTGDVRVRPVRVEQIQDIIVNPDDDAEVWYYRRTWTQRSTDGTEATERTVLYPDWQYRPTIQPATFRWDGKEFPIAWDVPMRHVKAGAFIHSRWGVPEVLPALPWTKAYKDSLEHDTSRSEALTTFAWDLTTGGGTQGVAAGTARWGTTLGATAGETNPPPAHGAAFVHAGKGQELKPISISAAILPTDHARPVRLMAAAALGLPETFFGDADVGNHATAKTLDRPTELRYNERRELWRDVFTGLIQFAIDASLAAPGGLLRFTPTEEARHVDLNWPDILEHSTTERVQAVVDAATLSGRSLAGTMPRELAARLLMVAVGVDDIDDQIAALEEEWAEMDARSEQMAQLAQQRPAVPGQPPERDEEREALVNAVRGLQEAVRGLAG